MKKNIFTCIVTVILIVSLTFSAFAADVTANFSGLHGMFSNGYFGFCIDLNLKGATSGEGFTVAENTLVAKNNIDGKDISQILKIFFVECFEDLFTVEDSGECQIIPSKAGTSIQGVIYNYSDNQSSQIWGEERKGYVKKIEAYDGPEIPDEGHTITLDNGKIITFYFMVLEPENEGVQSFFAVKAVASDGATHEHDYSDKWKSDDDNHWHECECTDKTDVGEHEGTTADCVNQSVCEVCKKVLGDVDSDNHTGNTEIRNAKFATEFEDGYTGDTHCADCGELLEKGDVIPATHKHDYSDKWKSDDDNHWHECGCTDKTDVGEHEGTTADCVNQSVCEVCKKVLGDVDSDNHTGNTEIRNAKFATEFEDGYTGDTHCADCGELLEKGSVIPATHKHDYSDKWKSDDDNHWHECECTDKTDVGEHEGTTADCVNQSVCEVCKKVLGDVDSDNHTGNTEIRNAKPATEFEDGYTGDTHCADCGELLEKGSVIPATHKHDYSDKWKSDDDNHWHKCDCGVKADSGKHSFVYGICSTCGFDSNNQKDNSSDSDLNSGTSAGNNSEENNNNINSDYGSTTDKNDNIDSETNNIDDVVLPDTGSNSDLLLICFTMFIISFAVMIIYSKKAKYTE